jgi:hypothetical protein
LRDTLKGGGQSIPVLLSSAGLYRAYTSSPSRYLGGVRDRYGPDLSLDAPSGLKKDFKNLVLLRIFQYLHGG